MRSNQRYAVGFTTDKAVRPKMTAQEFNDLVTEMVTNRWCIHDALAICRQNMAEIRKTGGERQRFEGMKLLRRIEIRLQQALTMPPTRAI